MGDRTQAEAAATALEAAAINAPAVQIVGDGYSPLESLSLSDPTQDAWTRIQRMMLWLAPFGFFAGFSFNQITHLTIWPVLSPIGNHLLGGLMGAVSGLLGGFTVNGGFQLLASPESRSFRQRLRQGKYLIVVEGSDLVIRQAMRVLQTCNPDSIQMLESQGSL